MLLDLCLSVTLGLSLTTPVVAQTVDWSAAYTKANAALAKLSLQDKVNIVTGVGWDKGPCVGNTQAISSISYPQLCLQDSPLGIRFGKASTAFTPGIQAASTWDIDLIRQRGQFMGAEAKAAGVHVQLGPVAGPLGKIAQGGRNWEGFGPDPYLTGIAMAETIQGMQGSGVQATAKHYILNEQEKNRETMSSRVDDRSMHELYLWPLQQYQGVPFTMDGDQNFNSSDLEFSSDDEPQPARRKVGQASIEKIIADAATDRVSSKKTIKKLQYQGAAPMTDYGISLWVARFDAFREQALRQSPETPFTGADLIRFLDSIISKIQPKAPLKPAPSLVVVQTAYKLILQYGVFRWSAADGFSITAHDAAQFKAFTIQAVKDKRLIKGSWNERTWTGFVTLSRLVRTFLRHSVTVGTWSFDLVIARCLSVVLISSLACRSGDVSQSNKYVGVEYLQYKHIELYLDAAGGGGSGLPQFQDLRAVVTLEYCKGYKDVHGAVQVRHLRPLDVQSIHVCPIALLITHALRNGLVYGTTLGAVLARAAARTDLLVEWKYPARSVLAAFGRGPSRCELDTPAQTQQVLGTIKMMGLVSGMLSRTYAHSLRLGAIRDYAHMSKNGPQASLPSTDETRRFAGHNFTTMHRGVTDSYVGDMAQDFYSARAENGGVHHRREPQFAVGGGEEAYWNMVQKPLQAEEIQAYIEKYKPGREHASLTHSERRTMGDRIRRDRVAALDAEPAGSRTASKMTEQPPPAPPPSVPQPRPPPSPRSRPRGVPPAAEAARPTTSKVYAGRDDDDHDDDLVEARPEEDPVGVPPMPGPRPSGRVSAAAATTAAASSGEGLAAATKDPNPLSEIDPALLDEEELASLDVADGDVEALRAVLVPGAVVAQGAEEIDGGVEEDQAVADGVASGPATQGNDNIEEAARVLLGGREEEGGPEGWTASKSHAVWIDGYARCNVVSNTQFARAWAPFSEGRVSFEESIGRSSLRGNSRDEPTPHIFHCRRTEGCGYSTIHSRDMEQHELACSTRRVEVKKASKEAVAPDAEGVLSCTRPGCTFRTSGGPKALNRHVKDKHEYIPQACEDCDDGVIYQSAILLAKHKTLAHNQKGRWPSACLFPGCPETHEYAESSTLIAHMRKKHGLSTPETYSPYLPPLPEKKEWVEQECIVPTCATKSSFASKKNMIAHLRAKHGMDLAPAKELVERDARMETVVPKPKPRVLGPKPGGINNNINNNNGKRGDQSLVAPGKENDPPAALDGVREQPGGHGTAGAEPRSKKRRVKKS